MISVPGSISASSATPISLCRSPVRTTRVMRRCPRSTVAWSLAAALTEFEPGTLIINDLGYFKHRYWAKSKDAKADVLSRLKENSNPGVTRVRHGVIAPVRSVGMKFNDLLLCRPQET